MRYQWAPSPPMISLSIMVFGGLRAPKRGLSPPLRVDKSMTFPDPCNPLTCEYVHLQKNLGKQLLTGVVPYMPTGTRNTTTQQHDREAREARPTEWGSRIPIRRRDRGVGISPRTRVGRQRQAWE